MLKKISDSHRIECTCRVAEWYKTGGQGCFPCFPFAQQFGATAMVHQADSSPPDRVLTLDTIHRFTEFKNHWNISLVHSLVRRFLRGPEGIEDVSKEQEVMLEYQEWCCSEDIPVLDFFVDRALNDESSWQCKMIFDLWEHVPQRVFRQLDELMNVEDPCVRARVGRYLRDHSGCRDSDKECAFCIDYNKWSPMGRQSMSEYLRQFAEVMEKDNSIVRDLVLAYLMRGDGCHFDKEDEFMAEYRLWCSNENRSMLVFLRKMDESSQALPAGVSTVLRRWSGELREVNAEYRERLWDDNDTLGGRSRQ